MRPTMLIQLACWMDGCLVRDTGPVQITAVHTDTRTLSPNPSPEGRGEPKAGEQKPLSLRERGWGEGTAAGMLFIALKGPNFDGHDHVADAAKLGASAAVVSREIDIDLPQIVVENTVRALAKLAAKLQSLRKTRVIAITGSNGKTTVKQLTVSILQHVGKTYFNPGNRNNEIGLPLAVIDAPEDAEFAVYEMGAGQPGDIAWLTAIAPPEIALVNNVAPAHLERMHNLLGIADTKAAVYDALPDNDNGVAVINADDAFAEFFADKAKGREILRFGLEASADVCAREIRHQADGSRFILMAPEGEAEIWLPLPGRHNVGNALAAAALALSVDAPMDAVVAGLSEAQPVKGRMYPHQLANGAILIDDSYNANPGSLAAAIEVLGNSGSVGHLHPPYPLPNPSPEGRGAKWLVLGDMRELGPEAEALHAGAGEQARKAGITRLFALGELSAFAADAFGDQAMRFETHDALIATLQNELAQTKEPPVMLVKGSRGSAMERVVNALLMQEDTRHAA